MEIINPVKYYKECGDVRYSCQYHVIFCTKYRRKVLRDEIVEHLLGIIKELQAEWGFQMIEVDIQLDHVYLILEIQPDVSVCSVVGQIKRHSSHILREKYGELRSRIPTLWTRVCFVSTVGNVALGDIMAFLEAQKKR